MTLKELIKMMKSKRLPADRRQFHQLASDIWPIAASMWTESQGHSLKLLFCTKECTIFEHDF